MDSQIRLQNFFDFIIEIDKLKSIFRQSYVIPSVRKENDAEHSWHISIMAILLAEYSNNEIDILKVVKMLLIHDIVEIDAGDTFAYDTKGNIDKFEREKNAANRLFSLLPSDVKDEFLCLWNEFELNTSFEANFANALDRIQPIMLNYMSNGKTWIEHGITYNQVVERNSIIKNGSEALWSYILDILDKSVELGYLKK